MHFQTWQDKAGNAPGVVAQLQWTHLPDLTKRSVRQLFLNNLIMP